VATKIDGACRRRNIRGPRTSEAVVVQKEGGDSVIPRLVAEGQRWFPVRKKNEEIKQAVFCGDPLVRENGGA